MPLKKNKNEEKNNKKPVSKLRKIISWIVTGVFTVIFATLATFQIVGMATRVTYQGGVTINNYFGYHVLTVLTDSMEDEYPVGTAIIVQPLKEYNQIKVNDDVTFLYDIDHNGKLDTVTHRIKEIQAPCKENNNKYVFTAHGINTHSENCKVGKDEYGDCTGQTQVFDQDFLIGKVVGQSRFVGFCINFLMTWYGLLIVLLIPALYLVITSIIDLIKAIKDDDEDDDSHSDDKKDKPTSSLSSEDKERLKKELLNEILEKKKAGES